MNIRINNNAPDYLKRDTPVGTLFVYEDMLYVTTGMQASGNMGCINISEARATNFCPPEPAALLVKSVEVDV